MSDLYGESVVHESTLDERPHCLKCNRILAWFVTRPWSLQCSRCKTTNNCAVSGDQTISEEPH